MIDQDHRPFPARARLQARSLTVALALTFCLGAHLGCRGKETSTTATPGVVGTPAEDASSKTPETDVAPPMTGDDVAEELIVWAEADPDSGPAPLSVKLGCDPIEEIEQPVFEWDFGDGSPRVREQNPTHEYRNAGLYEAQVTVTDRFGNRGKDQVEIEAEAATK